MKSTLGGGGGAAGLGRVAAPAGMAARQRKINGRRCVVVIERPQRCGPTLVWQKQIAFTNILSFVRLPHMLKRISGMLSLPLLLLAGCTSTFTNLTPSTQTRSQDNQYKVEVAMNSRQQTLRW